MICDSPLYEEAGTHPSGLSAHLWALPPFQPLRFPTSQSSAPCWPKATPALPLLPRCYSSCPELGSCFLQEIWPAFLPRVSVPSAQSRLKGNPASQKDGGHHESPETEWICCAAIQEGREWTQPGSEDPSWWTPPPASARACSGICPALTQTEMKAEKASGEGPHRRTHNPSLTPVGSRSLHTLRPFCIFYLSL